MWTAQWAHKPIQEEEEEEDGTLLLKVRESLGPWPDKIACLHS